MEEEKKHIENYILDMEKRLQTSRSPNTPASLNRIISRLQILM